MEASEVTWLIQLGEEETEESPHHKLQIPHKGKQRDSTSLFLLVTVTGPGGMTGSQVRIFYDSVILSFAGSCTLSKEDYLGCSRASS